MDERLVISENKAMKLLISTFLTVLLIGFAVGAYVQTLRPKIQLLTDQGLEKAQLNLGTIKDDYL